MEYHVIPYVRRLLSDRLGVFTTVSQYPPYEKDNQHDTFGSAHMVVPVFECPPCQVDALRCRGSKPCSPSGILGSRK